jgi:sialate O-acetylesterase
MTRKALIGRCRCGTRRLLAACVLIAPAASVAAAAEKPAPLEPAAIFAPNMVLQRGMEVPVWGTAAPKEKITVSFAGQTRTVTAKADGTWRVALDELKASASPAELVVRGSRTVRIPNVLVGEVWLFSGQSNAGFRTSHAATGKEAVAKADLPKLRFSRGGKWTVCSPKTAGRVPAVSFFFARALHEHLDIPVGVITAARGGTPAQAWTSRRALAADPYLKQHVLDPYLAYKRDYPKLLAKWKALDEAGRKTMPAEPMNPDCSGAPGVLFDQHIRPLAGFALRGMEWYQGESDAWCFERATIYYELLPALIRDWRDHWGQGDVPFLVVQLPNGVPADTPRPQQPSPWNCVQEAQARAARHLPKVGLAVTTDSGENDIHPRKKAYIGERLALAARGLAYGEDVVYAGPVLDRAEFAGGQAVVHFRHTGGGLRVGGGLLPKGGELKGFALAGKDRYFFWADARIEGDTVVCRSKNVPEPAAVRYGFSESPPCNLYNAEGLPAGPSRTDDWSIDIPTRRHRTARCVRADQAPTLDGNLDEALWDSADVQGDFVIRHSYRPSAHPTKVMFAYDAKHLYMAAAAAVSDRPVGATKARDKLSILRDDTVELFLDTNLDRRTYYRIVVNPIGTILDGRGYNNSAEGVPLLAMSRLKNARWFLTGWDSRAKLALKVNVARRRWTLELAVPWAPGVKPPKPGDKMGLQVIRHFATGAYSGREDLWHNERSQWINTGRDYNTGAMLPWDKTVHSPMRFGTLAFE